jgi:predicted nuclease of predicted toxin-antitoxin system
LLFDENLSHRLAARLNDLFPGSSHVTFENLLHADDFLVWDYARTNSFSIVTADGDFYDLAVLQGPPPKVVWLRGCDYPTAVAESLIRDQAIRLREFLNDPNRAVLILKP